MEMLIAMAIMAFIFAAVLPQFRIVYNTWDSRAGAAEIIQNGRVLIDHINRNLSKAGKITAVSDSGTTNGYIEFEDNDANNFRYDIAGNNYIEFGLVGDLCDLGGPVSKLQFTCYDANDFETPITDVNSIRFVKTEITLINQDPSGQDKTFTTHSYIRANRNCKLEEITKGTPFEYDLLKAETPALLQINSSHYLCAYMGELLTGRAVVLTVNPTTLDISSETPFEYDEKQGKTPALSQIDLTHYLCAYEGEDEDGWVRILKVNTGDWTISEEDHFEFEQDLGQTPSLVQIDQTHYLCAYTGKNGDGFAVVLSIAAPFFDAISMETPFEFDTDNGETPALYRIDDTHYLCAYNGKNGDGWATVLIVNAGTWEITKETPFEFEADECLTPDLAKIDDTHYLCAYSGKQSVGLAVVLTVNTGDWSISKETAFEYEGTTGITPDLAQMDQYNYLCAYTGQASVGYAVVLTVDSGDWTILKGTAFEYESTVATNPDLAKIGPDGYLCAFAGLDDDGWSVVLKLEDEVRP